MNYATTSLNICFFSLFKIELDDKDCNKNGFWNRKCSNMMITKVTIK